MQGTELYQHILGLKTPLPVSSVQLDVAAQQVEITAEHPDGTRFPWPECDESADPLPCYDHAAERQWRHLDSCQFRTILKARPPRVNCPTHGVKQVSLPWTLKGSRFTLLFERFAIDVLLATQTVKGATSILGTKWDQTWGIIERAVARGQLRKEERDLPRIGIDEKAFAKGQSYITLLYDLDNSTVEAIAMDMSAAYVKAAKQVIPLAEHKIVHDRFHIMQLATKAVDQVRRAEHKKLKANDDDRLAKTRYVWIKNLNNLSEKQQALFDETYDLQLQTGKAWAYKEMLRDLWTQPDIQTATGYFKDWYRSVIHTKLEPMKKVARTIKEQLDNVVSYCKHHITNAVAEGINSKIMAIKRRVGGYRNKQNFKIAVFFYLRRTTALPTLKPDGPYFSFDLNPV